MSPELQSKIAHWRVKAVNGTLSADEMREAITALRADRVGAAFAQDPRVTHCYRRPSFDGWPYSLFTMVHGHSREECDAALAEQALRIGADTEATRLLDLGLRQLSQALAAADAAYNKALAAIKSHNAGIKSSKARSGGSGSKANPIAAARQALPARRRARGRLALRGGAQAADRRGEGGPPAGPRFGAQGRGGGAFPRR